jgi:uncharacterized protein (DUF927 family)
MLACLEAIRWSIFLMGAINESFARAQRVDFNAVSSAALKALSIVVPQLLPGGHRESGEWVARNPTRNDAKPGSFKVNMSSGVWCDFATGDKGGDLIDLKAYLDGKSKLEAARELALLLNVRSEDSTSLTGNVHDHQRKLTSNIAATPTEAKEAPTFPARTPPNKDGKPRFVEIGDEGPRPRENEKRRHIYKRGGVPVRIKIMTRGDQRAFNAYRVADVGGHTGWQYRKPDGFKSVPYVEGDLEVSSMVFWPEGEKDVDSVAKQGGCAVTFGGVGDGLPAGCEQYFASKDLVILADNDEEGADHAEAKAALAFGVAGSVRVVRFPELENKQDVSDWFERGHSLQELEDRANSLEEWRPTEQLDTNEERVFDRTQKKSSLPLGYSFSDRGLMWSNPDDQDKPAVLVAGHFDVLAETRDPDGTSWGVLLHWKDHDGRDHKFALPRATLAGDGSEARRILMDGGFFISPSQTARNLFNSFLLQVKSQNRARATQRVGWHGNSFVMPDDCFGIDQRDLLLLQSASAHEHPFRQGGTLDGWKDNVARYAVGNSRLLLALSAAFAGPLIGPCSAEGGGIHFKGASSTGKSTALHVAGSVWGGGDTNGYIRSWRSTANGLEGVSLAHCDTLLCLDELSQLAAKDAGEAAYMLANGSGKSRSTRDGSARRAAKWRVLFLSSGEIGLSDKVAEDGRGKRLAAGQQIRIVDVSADAGAGMGMFEKLHGFASADLLAVHLKTATQQHYGVASRQFLSAMVPVVDEIRKTVKEVVKSFCETYVPAGADGQVGRVAQRFGLIAAGGEIATLYGIVPWSRGDAVHAAALCFEQWLAARGGHEAAETAAGIEQVRSFLQANGMARFIPAWEDNPPKGMNIRDVAGYRDQTGDGWDYYITTSAWKEICAGLDPRRTAAMLRQKGHLAGEGSHLAKSVRVPDYGKMRLYHIHSTFLEDANEA